jgi:ferrous iron transport protein A
MLLTKDLKPGDKVRLMDFGFISRDYRRHLMSMGLMKGVEIEVMPSPPVGCPWLINIKGSFLSFWPNMLDSATWEPLVCV